jgi:pSer/pThr/pTyr-binding forkhead associated (FHA) protein
LSLAVINGPDAGSVYRIEKPKVTIGRTGADLALSDSEISRAHAAVEIRDTTYLVEDLKSTNGTLIDGEKITGPTELQNQSEFTIGGSTIMLIVTEDM